MNALAQPAPPATPGPPTTSAAAPGPSVALLRTLVLCDLVDSTALVERLGDQRGAELLRKHDRLARALISAHGGREIDKTDGFLLMFERPVQAVGFALAYLRTLRELNLQEGTALAVRVGIHVGDILSWDNTPDDIAKGAKPIEVEGLVKPITSRLMQLALPDQILLSGVAHALAHRAQGELGAQLEQVRWRTHGRYRFKGIPDPIPVFEVGEEGTAPLKAPPWSGKAHREVPFWRRPATLGIELAVLFLLLAVPAWYLLKPEPAIAFAQRDWVVVGDLKNLTGETAFDDSLETAFRIGLEQSRHVNVLSDLKTRETIKRMQRDPDSTEVDRTVGSEIAIRDGARALILPTIAEIGGRVRITAEVVDPHTQTTVYSESADGVGEASVLPSLDQVNQKLRVRLGEALATVSKEALPLEKVTTGKLDALRAYTMAEDAYQARKYGDALSLHRQALKVDGDFALARIGLARTLLAVDDRPGALAELRIASKLRDRLTSRDQLYVDAWEASLAGPQRASLEKWKLLATLYPDYSTAGALYAYFSWMYANRYDDAIVQLAEHAASPQNERVSATELMLGMLHLGNERYAEAERHFAIARNAGFSWHIDYLLVDAARRDFAKVDASLAQSSATGAAGIDADTHLAEAAIAFDRGDWTRAWRVLDRAAATERNASPLRAGEFTGIELGLRTLVSKPESRVADVRERAKQLSAALGKAEEADRPSIAVQLLFVAYLAVREGDATLAHDEATRISKAFGSSDYPALGKLANVVSAEVARAEGRATDAVRQIESMLDGSEPYLAHVALMDAHAAAGNSRAALEQANWLATHRGRAYAEFSAPITIPFNVAQSNLALLRAAELQRALGEDEGAALLRFEKNWPDAKADPTLGARIRALRTKS